MYHEIMYNERRAAESAAYLLHRAGGTLPVIKLMKLLYLAERLSLQRYGEPITGDRLVSMPHGPVLSMTYEHTQGALPSCKGGWDTWVSDRAGHYVALRKNHVHCCPDHLLSLSRTDLEVLGETWDKFGGMDKWVLRDYTHTECPEWEDPQGSSHPISYKTLFHHLGYSPESSDALIARMEEQEEINAAFTAR
jgi:uncharacterized phage-associated protein